MLYVTDNSIVPSCFRVIVKTEEIDGDKNSFE